MSNSKHTSGPWQIQKDEERREIIVAGNTRGWGWDHLFSCTDVPELAANAHLIAAAPDMLEALENTAATLRRILKVSGLQTHAAESLGLDDDLTFINSVIAKAKGGA